MTPELRYWWNVICAALNGAIAGMLLALGRDIGWINLAVAVVCATACSSRLHCPSMTAFTCVLGGRIMLSWLRLSELCSVSGMRRQLHVCVCV